MITRESARVILINLDLEVFMFRSGTPYRPYWVLPGGGREEGESWEEAALRELFEETGLTDVELGPCVWQRNAVNESKSPVYRSVERYYVVLCGNPTITSDYQLEHEKAHYVVSGWWSIDAVSDSKETFYPEPFAELMRTVIAGNYPNPPLQLTR